MTDRKEPSAHPLYAVTIRDALDGNDGVSTEELRDLAEKAESVLTAQGDLGGWLEKLKAEISRRGG